MMPGSSRSRTSHLTARRCHRQSPAVHASPCTEPFNLACADRLRHCHLACTLRRVATTAERHSHVSPDTCTTTRTAARPMSFVGCRRALLACFSCSARSHKPAMTASPLSCHTDTTRASHCALVRLPKRKPRPCHFSAAPLPPAVPSMASVSPIFSPILVATIDTCTQRLLCPLSRSQRTCVVRWSLCCQDLGVWPVDEHLHHHGTIATAPLR
jgi:hypothetical protein